MKSFFLTVFAAGMVLLASAQAKRPISPSDVYRLQQPSSPKVSPDGKWVVYDLSSVDSAKDKSSTDLWMVSWDGKEQVQLTFDPGSEGNAHFSPDGKYISFIATRGDDKQSQLYLLDRRGGEAKKLTNIKGEIDDYDWSPNGQQLLLSIKDLNYADTSATKIRKPYVIDRYQFKKDYQGYLDSTATHLYVYTLATKKLDTLTRGIYNETQAVFSPDGNRIAFVSNRTEMPDKNDNTDIFVMEAKAGAVPMQLTKWAGEDMHPVWSPDGKLIAYSQSSSDETFTMYGQTQLALVPAAGGEVRILSAQIDRPVKNFRWSSDGKQIAALMQDDREGQVVAFDAASGKMTRLVTGEKSFNTLETNKAKNGWVTVMSTPITPGEIYAIEGTQQRKLTNVQDSFLAPLALPKVEGFRSKSKDGTIVGGILYRPANTAANTKLPLVIFIHGGPVDQDEYEFDMTRLVYASAGYAVAAVNYRGSSGRGVAYTKAIYSDWGNKEVMDVLGAADYLIASGVVDGNRMGLAGWSYGGITTNYTIATDQRFKAAVSGAGSSLQLSMYGSDQYISQYEKELGYPWKNTEKWLALSYPFLKADRIKTPTLFMASQNDFNVPVIGAEQMYQALKTLGVPTELIIYPGQNHGIVVPSYLVDRYKRHIAWFDKYLK
ncbi:S9 family peptidase [Flavihumibacter profundi]|uniref:S9 family peptidase n=1 Tax=Flavihumibacter profundi TaxID=2716883 RepID=UPI001CC6DB12|nr:S9 family peptidase [Flavihumibacter profundi]MBZ5859127.1 S9 family peptidase [Flavihumibacter profundi]